MKLAAPKPVPADIDAFIVELRGQQVILDSDLARIYGVEIRSLNQALKRNHDRFPPDFAFELTAAEAVQAQSLSSL